MPSSLPYVIVQLAPETKSRLVHLARKSGASMSAMARQVIDAYALSARTGVLPAAAPGYRARTERVRLLLGADTRRKLESLSVELNTPLSELMAKLLNAVEVRLVFDGAAT